MQSAAAGTRGHGETRDANAAESLCLARLAAESEHDTISNTHHTRTVYFAFLLSAQSPTAVLSARHLAQRLCRHTSRHSTKWQEFPTHSPPEIDFQRQVAANPHTHPPTTPGARNKLFTHRLGNVIGLSIKFPLRNEVDRRR